MSVMREQMRGEGGLRPEDKIFVAGHRGLVGRHLCEVLARRGYRHVVVRGRDELDLMDGRAVAAFFAAERPDVVFLAAARVGGILANSTYGADFLFENLQIQNSVIWGAHLAAVRRLVFLGSSCIYPRDAAQPLSELALLTGPPEPTNRPYAIAKIAGLELIETLRRQYGRDYFSVMPTNLYGPGDNFHPTDSHVIPGLVRRFCEARRAGDPVVTVWGSGRPRREFLFAGDCAEAIVFLAERLDTARLAATAIGQAGFSHINIGTGPAADDGHDGDDATAGEVTIADLARQIADAVGYPGTIHFDPRKPDGAPRKRLDSSVLFGLGWRPCTSLSDGLRQTVDHFERELAGAGSR